MMPSSQKTENLWLISGFLILFAYAFSLLKIKAVTIALLVASGISVFSTFIFSEIGLLAVCFSLAIPLLLFSGKHISWDVESFEIQGYFDWINGIRGAYWDYSKLPTMLYGSTFSSGSLIRGGFYGFTLISFAASISQLANIRKSPTHWSFYIFLTFVFTNTLSGLWDYGKGDILTTSFLLLSYAFAISYKKNSHEIKSKKIVGFILFSCLAAASKMYAIFYIGPVLIYLMVSEWKEILKALNRPPVIIMTAFPIIIGSSFYIYNIATYGEIIDTSIIPLQSGLAIKDNFTEIINGTFLPPQKLNAAIVFISLALCTEGIYKNLRIPFNISIYTSLAIGIIFTPLTLIHGIDFSYNFRLISFPIIFLMIFHEGFS